MSKLKDLTGLVFGRLTVIKYIEKRESDNIWLCQCSCVNNTIVEKSSKSLLTKTKSCGCLIKENNSRRRHNLSESKEYRVWRHIKDRCLNENDVGYKDYGGRNIKICDRWKDSFENFYEDMGDRPSPKHSIDRKDNNKDYCKENCEWATVKEQSFNKRNTIFIEFDGKVLNTEEWSKITGLTTHTIRYRYNAGWTAEEILTIKPRGIRHENLIKRLSIE